MEITENDKSKIYELHKNGMKISDLAIMFVGELSTESILEVLTAIREIKKKKEVEFTKFFGGNNRISRGFNRIGVYTIEDFYDIVTHGFDVLQINSIGQGSKEVVLKIIREKEK